MHADESQHRAVTAGLSLRVTLLWVALLATALAIVITTAIRIEVLNAMIGGALPATERHNDGHIAKWRVSPWTTEAGWRAMLGPRDERGKTVQRPLNEVEKAQMQRDIRDAQRRNKLRDIVSSWGLAQYFMVPFALLASAGLLGYPGIARWARMVGAGGLILAIGAGGLMFYRGYFSSLGW